MGRIGDARDRVSQFEVVTWSPGAPAGSSAFECLDRPGRRLLEKLAIGRADSGLDPLPVTNGGVVVDHLSVTALSVCVVCPCGKIWRQWQKREKVVRIPTSKRCRFPPFDIFWTTLALMVSDKRIMVPIVVDGDADDDGGGGQMLER
ncbi:hypothetical protein T4E_11057 [Trichinella pseudospiralis]|uniref:Uncharacterized protein n=1 Tax=Trichinella pseudospiralis TaxID=6337 RepID=A0A0V0XK05_TRIPS|nr:hypothetical protein T4E_11057 [Trichinella pseudospiralis]